MTTATKPASTLPSTLSKASHQLPSRINLNVSHSNVENVVYPPQNPVPIRRYQSRCSGGSRSRNSTAAAPRMKEPLTLMTNVPQGNVSAQGCEEIQRPSQ